MTFHRYVLALLLLTGCLAVGSASPSPAQPFRPGAGGAPELTPNELIVRVRSGDDVPTPEEVVERHRSERTLPGSLGFGNPHRIEYLISQRGLISPETLARDPDGPRARLERTLVLTYPPSVDLAAVRHRLAADPAVERVGRNRILLVSAIPSDPFFDETDAAGNPRPPEEHQWGSFDLNLPSAWDGAKGHAFVGVVDSGIDTEHPDLRGLYPSGGSYLYDGGNFRPHLTRDTAYDDDNVDEGQSQDTYDRFGILNGNHKPPTRAGHGTHVAGIVGATTDNSLGVAGSCWNCSLIIAKTTYLVEDGGQVFNFHIRAGDAAEAVTHVVDHDGQVINVSFGWRATPDCATATGGELALCDALQFAADRDVVTVAASGNDHSSVIDWPASDPRTIAAGALDSSGSLFYLPQANGAPGSNWDPGQLVAPGHPVLSTFHRSFARTGLGLCADEDDGSTDGYGLCTGTSMASPYLAGAVGLLRSINPLLSRDDVFDLLTANLNNPAGWSPADGIGRPDIAAAAQDALGRVGGHVLDNRLTPLFSLYSGSAEDHAYTTAPQSAASFLLGSPAYATVGPRTAGYDDFPDAACQVGGCLREPKASVYVFSTDRSPNAHPLVPLYRMTEVTGTNVDHTYTTEEAGITSFATVPYELDGIEGYVYERCTPEPSCIPVGAVRLYRLYHPTRDDWAIFPESELAQMQSAGYGSVSGFNDWIGYVYENVDSDSDWLVDGFEGLIGTDPNTADSDCDGSHDGAELFKDTPYGDPLDGTCSSIVGEVGQVTDLRHVSKSVVLSRSYTNPVVIARPPSFNGSHQSVVRITDVQSDRFTFRVEEAPDLDGSHTFETVSYVVIEAGSWQLPDGTEIEAGTLSTAATVGRNFAGSFATVSFSQPFAAAPVVLSQIQTANDPSWAKTRQLLASTSSFRVALEEDEASTTGHGTETVGWVAVSPGTGVWSGHRFEAASTANAITDAFAALGFTQGFASPPRFLAALATRDGADNSALRYTSLSTTGVSVKVEEDTTFDTEVGHTSEVVSYLALQGDGTFAANPR